MNIQELDDFHLGDAVNFHSELNPQLYVNGKMRPPVRAALLGIAQDFIEFIGVPDIALVDITVSGSNAAYSYTPHSDIDLHLIVDFDQLSNDEVYQELFDAKKYQYNEQHDIKVRGYEVEVYVQKASEPHVSLGNYSVNRDDWNKIPVKKRANLNDDATRLKYEKLKQLAIQALAADNHDYLNRVLNTIKRYRRTGLEAGGEFSPENLAFKLLRQEGYFRKLWDKKRDFEDRKLSLEHINEDIQEFNFRNKTPQIEETLKQMYKSDNTLFDRYTFDTVYAGATKLVEFGRVVKGVNTTADVGVDQIKIEADKLGFKVTKDGVPPLLREAVELTELDMGPGNLQKQVSALMRRGMTPIVGVEMEVCWPRDSDFESPGGEEITTSTDLSDIESFFEHNSESDFMPLKQDYDEWLFEKEGTWVAEQTQEAINTPGMDVEYKVDAMVDNYTPTAETSKLIKKLDPNEEEISTDLAKKVLEVANKTFEKFGPAGDWGDILDDLKPEAQLYFKIFVDEDDEAAEYLKEKYSEQFFEHELPWNDDTYGIGVFLKNYRGYDTMRDLFYDYSDELYWPGGSLTDEVYDDDIAHQIAADLSELELNAAATGEYHGGQIDDNGKREFEWNIEEDTSIAPNEGDAGFEIISPPMEYDEALGEIQEVIGYLKDNNAYTNDSTGLHINVSIKGVDFNDIDYTKLVLLIGDQHVLNKFGRQFNSYAISTSNQILNYLQSAESNTRTEGKLALAIDQMHNKVDKVIQDNLGELNFGKSTSVGIKDNYIEFRAAGGSNYLDNWDTIQATINRVIIAYAAAADPEVDKKNYAKKLYKLVADAKSTSAFGDDALKLFALYASGSIDKSALMDRVKTLRAKRKMAKDPMGVIKEKMKSQQFLSQRNRSSYDLEHIYGHELKKDAKFFIDLLMKGWKEEMAKQPPKPPNILQHMITMMQNVEDNLIQNINYYGQVE